MKNSKWWICRSREYHFWVHRCLSSSPLVAFRRTTNCAEKQKMRKNKGFADFLFLCFLSFFPSLFFTNQKVFSIFKKYLRFGISGHVVLIDYFASITSFFLDNNNKGKKTEKLKKIEGKKKEMKRKE